MTSWSDEALQEPQATRGTLLGVDWEVGLDPAHPRIVIGGREVDVRPDGSGGFVSHQAFGHWTDLVALAHALVRSHPDFSPLARGQGTV